MVIAHIDNDVLAVYTDLHLFLGEGFMHKVFGLGLANVFGDCVCSINLQILIILHLFYFNSHRSIYILLSC